MTKNIIHAEIPDAAFRRFQAARESSSTSRALHAFSPHPRMITSKASVMRASPARIAMASPNSL